MLRIYFVIKRNELLKMEKKFVYADNAATTAVSKPVLDEMMPYFTEEYGNASSIYALGRSAKKALETARERIAKTIGADTSEIYFTSCGSESDNWAIRSVAERLSAKGKKHIITSVFINHPHPHRKYSKKNPTRPQIKICILGLKSVYLRPKTD